MVDKPNKNGAIASLIIHIDQILTESNKSLDALSSRHDSSDTDTKNYHRGRIDAAQSLKRKIWSEFFTPLQEPEQTQKKDAENTMFQVSTSPSLAEGPGTP